MIDEMYKKATGELIVTEGQRGWFVSSENLCLCEVDFSERKGRILRYLGCTDSGLPKYKGVVKCEEYLYVYPYLEEHIAVFDLNGVELKKIPIAPLKLLRENGSMFNGAIVNGKYVFFLGAHYPAIIRFDVETEQLDYLKDLQEDANSIWGCFMEGAIVRGKKLYCPLGYMPGVLELDISEMTSRIIRIDTIAEAIRGITKIDDKVWVLTCIGSNANRILIWDVYEEKVNEEIEYLSPLDAPRPTYNGIKVGDKIFWGIQDWAFKIFNEYNIRTNELKKNEILNQLDYGTPADNLGGFVTKSVFAENDKILHFAAGKDLKWYEYNAETDEIENYDIFFEGTEEIYSKIFADKLWAGTQQDGFVKETEIPLEGLINFLVHE